MEYTTERILLCLDHFGICQDRSRHTMQLIMGFKPLYQIRKRLRMQNTVRINVDDVFPFGMKQCHIQGSGFSLLGIHPFQVHLRMLLLIGCIYFKGIVLTAVVDQ